jgi:hypothetical protein
MATELHVRVSVEGVEGDVWRKHRPREGWHTATKGLN